MLNVATSLVRFVVMTTKTYFYGFCFPNHRNAKFSEVCNRCFSLKS